MTNEQLTQEVIKLAEHQAKCDVEKEQMLNIIDELREDLKSTKSLAEDVHIMAINIKNMQETLNNTVKNVSEIQSKEYKNYEKNKNTVKNNVLSTIGTSLGIGILALGIWFINNFMKGGN